jgi:zinc protease
LAAIKAQQDDPMQVTMRLGLEGLYRSHPYGLDPLGNTQSVSSFTPRTLEQFSQRIIAPEAMVLSVYGDLPTDRARRLADRYFLDWRAQQPAAVSLAPEPSPSEPRRVQVEREQQQAIICFMFPGARIDSEDRFALDVLDAVFSGIGLPGGRLHRKLRGDQLVYATHMVPVAGIEPGYVIVYAATQPETLDVVENLIRELITDVQSDPMPEDEIARGRSMCIAAHEVDLGQLSDRMMQEGLDELYGLGFQATLHYATNIDAVTAEQVRDAARKYMDLSQAVVAITRPPAASQ